MEEMKAEERRRAIAKTLTAEHPVSATALAGQFSVSRQIIVGDIALLRAAGLDIVATPRATRPNFQNEFIITLLGDLNSLS